MKRFNIQTHPELKTLHFVSRPVTYTRHAKERANEKRIPLPKSIHINAGDVVEIELIADRLSKLVVRQSISSTHDRIIVLVPNGDGWAGITTWLNRVDDTHSTLKKDRISA